jgi:O-antigen ligase
LIWGIDSSLQKNYNFSPLLNFAPTRRIIESFSFEPYTSGLWRIELWQDMSNVFWKRPWFGHGLGSFEEEALKQRGFYAGSLEAHNDYLRIAVELGIIGLASYILLILVVLKNIIKIYRKTDDKNLKIFYLSFLCLFVSLFLVSFVENILRNTIVQWCLWTWAGCVFSLSELLRLK